MLDMQQAQSKLLLTMNQAWPTKSCKSGPNTHVQLYAIKYCKVIYKIKTKLLHDLCSCSTLFLGLCEKFLLDGINDCKIQIPDFTVI